ncbi:MAG TPA: molecular chaperone TorD family protein [Thermoleophilia bacterium]|nr:molecular chaperone TorD family protein [Thermoleophilia bacterium]
MRDADSHGVPNEDAAGPPQGGPAARPPKGKPGARLADVCARRAAVYQALALGFGEPTLAYLTALADGELVDGLREAVAWLGPDAAAYEPAFAVLSQAGAAVARTGVAAAVGAAAVEHARLFTGPGRPAVPCYASQYLDAAPGRAPRLNEAAAYAAAAYEAEGVVPADLPRELPDHVAIELEFLFHLCRREEAAWDAGDAAEATRLRRALDAFLREHAARFFAGFAGAVAAALPAALYAALAELLAVHAVVELGEQPPARETDRRPSAGETGRRPPTGDTGEQPPAGETGRRPPTGGRPTG